MSSSDVLSNGRASEKVEVACRPQRIGPFSTPSSRLRSCMTFEYHPAESFSVRSIVARSTWTILRPLRQQEKCSGYLTIWSCRCRKACLEFRQAGWRQASAKGQTDLVDPLLPRGRMRDCALLDLAIDRAILRLRPRPPSRPCRS